LERAIRPLVEQVGRWPTTAEFRRASLGSALTAVYSHEGVLWWQQRLGVDSSPRRGPVPDRRIWTDEEIERELRAYCGELGVWRRGSALSRTGRRSSIGRRACMAASVVGSCFLASHDPGARVRAALADLMADRNF
jgi:hypothetical protein